jgi:Spy/CpxP family protein refolding chaperone
MIRWAAALGMGLLVIVGWGSGVAPAQTTPPPAPSWRGGWDGGSPFMWRAVLRGVGLTDSQQAQVRQIVAGHRPQFQTLRGQLRTAQQQLADKLYGADPVTLDGLALLTLQIAQLREQLAREALQTALDIRAVLTPDQLAKAAQIRQRLTELRSEMRSLTGGQ